MASAAAAIVAALSFRPPSPRSSSLLLLLKPLQCPPLLSSSVPHRTLPKLAATPDIDTSFFDNVDPTAPPEGYVPQPAFDELPPESEEEVAAAYEEIYGPAYSGESVLGYDVYVMDAKVKKASGLLGRKKRDRPNDGGFRSESSRSDGDYGAAKVMLWPASPGTSVIAGGAVRNVLEMAGVENALGKQLGSKNALNNVRATVAAVQKMRQFREVARECGIPMEELWQ